MSMSLTVTGNSIRAPCASTTASETPEKITSPQYAGTNFAAQRSSKAETTAGAPNDKHVSIARNMYVHGHWDGLPKMPSQSRST